METWLTNSGLSPLSELLPLSCLFLNSLCLTGRGGGLLSIFKDKFSHRQIVQNKHSSFELKLFTLELNSPLLIALLYHPPKYNADFLNKFTGFLGEIVPKYDKLLILGDFNIHVCCTTDPLA